METIGKTLLKFWLGVFLCIAAAQMLPAQVYYATLVGTVKDPTGAVVPGAKVVATEVSTGVASAAAVTEGNGDYRIATLRPGKYTIAVTKAGFKEKIVSEITLLVAQTSRVDIAVELGQTSEKVTVVGSAPLVQTETAERGGVMNQREIEALPLRTRNVTELTYLVPGSVRSDSYGVAQADVHGLSSSQNSMLVDGGNNTSFYMAVPAERLTIDNIQEFKIETANNTADRGLMAGSTVSVATKSGTNQFHGTLFEFLRNDWANARNFFAATVPRLRYNQFGGNVGGPIKRNKVFFFASYEGSREPRAVTMLGTVPTAAEKAGNFTFGTGSKDAHIYDPLNLDTEGNRIQFTDDQIPQSSGRWNDISTRYLPLWPAANYGVGNSFPNYFRSAASTNTEDRASGRVDFNLSDKDTLLVRVGWQRNPGLVPSLLPMQDATQNLNPGQVVNVTWSRALSPRIFNEARFSHTYTSNSYTPLSFAGQNINKEWGFEDGDRLTPKTWGLPGAMGLGGLQTWAYPNHTYRAEDNITFVRGPHTIKAGGLFQRYGIDRAYGRVGGVRTGFSGLYTAPGNHLTQVGNVNGGQPWADFLLGYSGSLAVQEKVQTMFDRKKVWHMFVMDDWKARSNLVVQLGLRYELSLPSYVPDGRAGAWIDGLGSRTGQVYVMPANAKTALAKVLRVTTLNGGADLGFPYRFLNNNYLSKTHLRDFGPRLGIAWRPFHDTKTVIRGGVGIYYAWLLSTYGEDRNRARPWENTGSTSPRALAWEAPPYTFGQAPVMTAAFAPGEPFRSNYTFYEDWPNARVLQYNVTFQRELRSGLALDVGYVGNRQTRALSGGNLNAPRPPGYIYKYDDGTTFTVPADPATPIQQTKKYPELNNGTVPFFRGRLYYHSLQVAVRKTMSHGIQFQAGYTRSRLTQSFDQGSFQDEWATITPFRAAGDRPNNFYLTYVIELPGHNLKGALGLVAGGWQWSGIVSATSGATVPVTEGYPQWRTEGARVLPKLVGDPNKNAPHTIAEWFDTSAFAQPGVNQYGDNESWTAARADGFKIVDMAVSKFFRIREGIKLQARLEAFNTFNHTVFGVPGKTRGLPTFGRISSAMPARELQFGLKFQF